MPGIPASAALPNMDVSLTPFFWLAFAGTLAISQLHLHFLGGWQREKKMIQNGLALEQNGQVDRYNSTTNPWLVKLFSTKLRCAAFCFKTFVIATNHQQKGSETFSALVRFASNARDSSFSSLAKHGCQFDTFPSGWLLLGPSPSLTPFAAREVPTLLA